MKKKLVLILALIVMLVSFSSCESEPSHSELNIPQRLTTVKTYNSEIFDLVASSLEDSASDRTAASDPVVLDAGITCSVTSFYDTWENLFLTFDEWVAADGTEISGNMEITVEYYSNTRESINTVSTNDPAILYFDSTSVSYLAESIDDGSSDSEFISRSENFLLVSLIVDGKHLVNNQIGYK
jgi:hypothetical protein